MIKLIIVFIKKTLTFKRIFNLIKITLSYFISIIIKKPLVWGYPPIVMIEPTDICNLKCPMCPSGNGSLTRAKGFMNFDTFKKIIDSIHPYSFMILLWNQGEPFLNKELLRMTKYASKKKLFVIVSTNGSLQIDAKAVVKSGIDNLIFSIDGIDQESYEKYRKNGNLDLVLKNLKDIIKEKRKLNKKLPIIEWQFIVFKHNEKQIEKVKEISKSLKVDLLSFKTAQIYTKEDIKYLPTNKKYLRYNIKNGNFELKIKLYNRCRRIWTQPVINWNGEMAVCCFDKDNTIKLGNILKNSFLSIWKGERYNNFRKKILTNRSSIPICKNCGEGIKLKFLYKKSK